MKEGVKQQPDTRHVHTHQVPAGERNSRTPTANTDPHYKQVEPHQLASAANFAASVYRNDPLVLELFEVDTPADLTRLKGVHSLQCRAAQIWPWSVNMACLRSGRWAGLVTAGVVGPDSNPWMTWLRYPLTMTRLRLAAYFHRPRLTEKAMQRWRGYIQLAEQNRPTTQHLHVYQLAVHVAVRRQGIARRLLDETVSLYPNNHLLNSLVVDTWHANNVAIYQRLGFETLAHSQDGDISCWTMGRPITAPPEDNPSNATD